MIYTIIYYDFKCINYNFYNNILQLFQSTSLNVASDCGHVPLCELLLNRGADVNSKEGGVCDIYYIIMQFLLYLLYVIGWMDSTNGGCW